MSLLRRIVLLTLLLTILVACSPPAPAAAPQAGPLPTAAIGGIRPTRAVVMPESMPPIVSPERTIEPTQLPIPTPLPQPPTPTLRPVGPGSLPFPLRTERLEFGIAAHLFYTDRYTPLSMARDAGFGWIRQQIHWKDQEGPPGFYAWGELDDIVADVNAQGLKLLISIVRSPSFYTEDGNNGLPREPGPLGDFVAALATRYQGRVHAIQIWNEQNLAHENGGYVSLDNAGHYVELLKDAYTRIKEVDPSIFVVTGAPASTAVNSAGIAIADMRYYRAMFAYQGGIIRNYADAIAIHPGGSANPPETLWPDNPSQAQGWTNDATFYYRNIENAYRLMQEYGLADRPVWITEFGWATHNTTPGFEFGEQVSFEQQAAYTEQAMRMSKQRYPWIGNMFVWNLNFAPLRAQSGDPLHEQASFGILNADYSPRPVYLAIQRTIAELNR